MTTQSFDKTCAQCRHHATEKKPQVTDSGALYSTFVEFADEDAVVFLCRAASGPFSGKEVGTLPVFCEAFEAGAGGKTALSAEMDARIAAAQARWAKRNDDENR
jgi:hypothetical protein